MSKTSFLDHKYRARNTARLIRHKQISERIDRTLRGQRASEFRDYREPSEDYDHDHAGLSATA